MACSAGRMSRRCEMQGGAQDRRVDVARALREAGVTALLAFGMFLPLIGFQTVQNIRNELILTTRWPLLFAITAIVGACRLAYALAFEPWLMQRRLRPVPAAQPAWRAFVGKWFTPFAI